MALPKWTVLTGYDLGTVSERSAVNISLPLQTTTGVSVNLISGSLPPGCRLENFTIKGFPFEVARTTEYEFVLRASTNEGVSDRTFRLTIEGPDVPTWQTPEGLLSLTAGSTGQYWIDTRNTRWGIYASNSTNIFSEVTVVVYDTIPSQSTGNNGDYGFIVNEEQFYYKFNNKWNRMTTATLQSVVGSDTSLFVGATVPNPNLIDFWFNTNKNNNGFDLKIKRFNETNETWEPQTYSVGLTPPLSFIDGSLWIQTFRDSISFVVKRYSSLENAWEVLNVEYGVVPPDRKNKSFFVLDNTIVDFQLQAIDSDLRAGQNLLYYIADGDGELPPGLKLSSNGRITGIIDPLLSLDININPGYDNNIYDGSAYDLGVVDNDGYDSYFYDTQFYGFFTPTRRPKKLNRYYNFTVTVADDVSEAKRDFQIYVVGDDFLRADNTIMKSGTGIFTADATFLRKPVWLTSSNLGVKRADNYITAYLDVFDPNSILGVVTYILRPFNDDGTESVLPPGMTIDNTTGEIAGRVGYQPAISKEYRFTVEAIRSNSDLDVNEINANVYEDTLSGRTALKIFKLPTGLEDGLDDLQSLVDQNIQIENYNYEVVSTSSSNPLFDVINLDRPLEPSYRANVLTIYENANIGQNYFYVNELQDTDANFYLNKKLNFSSTESYTLTDLKRYLRYSIGLESGGVTLGFNYGNAELTEIPGETLSSALIRFWSDENRNNVRILPADIRIISETSDAIEFDIPANSLTRNRNFIRDLFHSEESSALVYADRSNEFHKVYLNTNLTRNLTASSQYSLGVPANTLIVKRLAVANNEIISTVKTFTLTILGEVDSTISWITPSELPTQFANRISYLKVEAQTNLVDSLLRYDLISGRLPFGLELKKDGEIVGKINQFASGSQLGLTTIDNRQTTFDGGTTTYDRKYTFTVLARDRFGFAASAKTFSFDVVDIDEKVYSNIYMQPYIKPSQKSIFESFINNYNIFTPEYVYRPSDSNFGIQKSLRTLAFAGIETKNIGAFASVVARNHKKKRFKFGELKTAVAKQPGTNDVVYEVVYVDIIDPAESLKDRTRLNFSIKTPNLIKVNQVRLEIKDDVTSAEEGVDFFTITPREGNPIKIRADLGNITVITRNDSFVISASGQLEIILRSEVIAVVRSSSLTSSTSGDPFRFRSKQPVITADSNAIKAGQSKDVLKYISNISNMRQRVSEIGATERQFLPLWMRTSQGSDIEEIDYVTAMPVCYCKPGTAQLIKENIINSGFNFNQIDYEIDRYIVDKTTENEAEQFILFPNYIFNV